MLPVRASLIFLVASGAALAAATLPPEQVEFFEQKIRPVLASECSECHDAKKQKGGLRLDYRDGWKKGGDSGAAIVPGQPAQSLLLKSIRHEDPDLQMPQKRPKLSSAVLADFEKWIALGAPDPRDEPPKASPAVPWATLLAERQTWWSLQPIRKSDPPAVQHAAWSPHPVDRFLLAKMEARGLAPAADAEPRAILRRLTFALTGLPPSAEEVADFVREFSATAAGEDDAETRGHGETEPARSRAIEHAADRLLATARFGERWARHWMDLVRYAETHGSEGDPEIPEAWRYRDYLIRALNADVPVDQIIREHLAGDLLPHPRMNAGENCNESILGLAHLRFVEHGFQPVDTRDEQVKTTDSQIDVAMKAFQGLTVSCARCHDHKFDAISQRDYYALAGIFESSRPAMVTIDPPELLAKNNAALAALKGKIRTALFEAWKDEPPRIAARLLAEDDATARALAETEKGSAANPFSVWFSLHRRTAPEMAQAWQELAVAARAPSAVTETAGRTWEFSRAGGDFAECFHYGTGIENAPGACGDFAVLPAGENVLSGLMPAGVVTNRLSAKHNGVLTTKLFRVETDFISVRAWGGGGAQVRLIVDGYPLGTNPIFPRAQLAKDEPGWLRLDTKYRRGSWAYLEFATSADQTRREKGAQERSWFGVSEIVCHDGEALPHGRENNAALFSAGEAPRSAEELASRYEAAIAGALAAWHAGRADESQRRLLDFLLRRGLLPVSLARLGAVKPLLAEYRRLEAEVPVARRAPGVLESVAHDAALLPRGDHLQPGESVPRAFLGVLGGSAYETKQSGRLELARALTAPQNPLTARVMVNRIWLHLFGRGLVATPDNFGRMGEPPTHPELLDTLAARFAEEDWSLKRMVRFLITSRAFLLSTDASAEARERDGANELLSHARIQRLEAEAIRDALLAVSGRLDSTMGGPGLANNSTAEQQRRSIYLTIRRTALNPFLEVFDAPKPFTTTGQRDATNVPAQSLTLLNDRFVIDSARAWADRMLAENADASPADRIRRMFAAAFAREPDEQEISASKKYLAAASTGPLMQNAPAWRDFAQSLFNAKEFIFLR